MQTHETISSASLVAGWLVLNLALVGVWDITAYAVGPPMKTVSSVFQGWAHEFPPLPLLVGILLGHLFWN